MPLVISLKHGECVQIGPVFIRVSKGGSSKQVRMAIEAPRGMEIIRVGNLPTTTLPIKDDKKDG